MPVATVPSWQEFWRQTPGWHRDLTLLGASGENSYKDAEPVIAELARQGRLPAKTVRTDIGTVNRPRPSRPRKPTSRRSSASGCAASPARS
jgi:hypothetical protein